MKRRALAPLAAAACALWLAAAAARAGGVPEWLAEAAVRPLPPGSDHADAAYLHRERVVSVPSRGRVVTVTRSAVRVLRRDGMGYATAFAPYVRGTSEVTGFRCWALNASGGVLREWGKRDAIDVSALGEGQLYTDQRVLVSTDPELQPGQTYAVETEVEEEPLFAQWYWPFRAEIPCARSRFELKLPAGLDVSARLLHADSARTRQASGAWSWEMNALAALPEEPLSPGRPDLGAGLRVQVVSAGSRRTAAGVSFAGWPDAAAWVSQLAADAAAPTPALAERARSVSGGTPDTLARIVRLARYVQGLNYVATNERLGIGWGFRPHAAAAVLAAGYGDCKDKANLLRAMLRAEGLEAWLMPIYWGNREHVDSSWVELGQFNHCITAIRVPASYRGPLVDGGRAGRIAAFDPTDPITTFGDLPLEQQGSRALLVDPEMGRLVRMPVLPLEDNRMVRRIDATLEPDGALHATLLERSVGQAARDERELRRGGTAQDYRRRLEAGLPNQGGAVRLQSVETAEDSVAGGFELRVEYDWPSFARSVAGRMLTFRTSMSMRRRTWTPSDTARAQPIALEAQCLAETVTVKLPAGFALEERPADLSVASDLGRCEAKWSEQGGALVMTRRWEVQPVTVEASRWADVRALYAALRASNEAAVVLVRR